MCSCCERDIEGVGLLGVVFSFAWPPYEAVVKACGVREKRGSAVEIGEEKEQMAEAGAEQPV